MLNSKLLRVVCRLLSSRPLARYNHKSPLADSPPPADKAAMRVVFAVNFVLFSCYSGTPTPGLSTPVFPELGHPAPDVGGSVIVTVTDLESRREISNVRMNSRGLLIPEPPPGRYAFAVTTNDSFAYLEQSIKTGEPAAITLSRHCHRLQGRLKSTATSPARVTLSRFSESVGDSFVVMSNDSGTFEACLPTGLYRATVDGNMRSISRPIEISSNSRVEITAYPKSQIEFTPADLSISPADLNSFARSLSSYRIIGMGEANHGTADFYDLRGRLSLELADSNELRLILLEADAVAMTEIDDFVMGKQVDITKAILALGFWITDIWEFHSFIKSIREYNIRRPTPKKLHLLGIDAQDRQLPTEFLLAHRFDLVISDHEADLLSKSSLDHGAFFKSMSPDEKNALIAMLDRLSDIHASSPNLESNEVRGGVAAKSLKHQLGYLTSTTTPALRDRAMADIATYITELSKSRQVALWAHNGHIARQFEGIQKTLGQHISEKFGQTYFPIAFLSYRGAGRAWDKSGKIGVISHELAATPSYNVESVVMKATGYPEVAWVRLDQASGTLAHWLSTPRYVREFGALYDPEANQKLRTFPTSMAAVVVVRDGKPSSPTPTGVRMIKQ